MNTILLVAYNRPHYFSRVLDGLRNQNTDGWNVVCHIDGPKEGESTSLIEENVHLAKTSPLGVEVKQSPVNLGLHQNVLFAIDDVFRAGTENLIVLEDDILPLKGFMEYMRWGLGMVERNAKVQSAVAYSHPLTRDLPPDFAQTFNWFTPWGWATTRKKWFGLMQGWVELVRVKGFDAAHQCFLDAHPRKTTSVHFFEKDGKLTAHKSWARLCNQIYEVTGLLQVAPLIPRAINIGEIGTNQKRPMEQTTPKIITSDEFPVYEKLFLTSCSDSTVETQMRSQG